ncbi:MAG: dCMP deaminase family protein [Gloeomargarita sp. GMQP_bins_120]
MPEAGRPSWDEYFLMLAKLAATRSTCLALPVGAVIVKQRQVLATGYNGPPSGSPHCTAQGFCYPGLPRCDLSRSLPSRAIHAEANAIAQAARYGISTEGATIYVTLAPCLACLKLIISAGIREVVYETPFHGDNTLQESFIREGLLRMRQVQIDPAVTARAIRFLQGETSLLLPQEA